MMDQATETTPQTLRDALKHLEPALQAVTAAEAAVEDALEMQRRAVAKATKARQDAFDLADAAKVEALGTYEAATIAAQGQYDDAVTRAGKTVTDARAAYAAACADAEPLLKALQDTTERVSSVASRARAGR